MKVPKHAQQARELVIEAWPAIIQGLIKKAASGGAQQAKLLLELCDLAAMENASLSQEHRQQLCDALLAGWRLTSSAAGASSTTKTASLDAERRADDSTGEDEKKHF